MIICVDIGNTNIVVGSFENKQLRFQCRLSTDLSRTSAQYAVELAGILRLHECDSAAVHGAVVGSVVPRLISPMAEALRMVTGADPLILSAQTLTGLRLALDNPAELGADLKATAVAALAKYPLPCIVIDMGTATTFSVLSADGVLLGGAIAPGLRVSLESLVSHASMLVDVALEPPQHAIGTDTADCIRSGAVLGTASMVDGLCARMSAELSTSPCIVATGGLAHIIAPFCHSNIILDENLLLEGLRMIYEMNQNRKII